MFLGDYHVYHLDDKIYSFQEKDLLKFILTDDINRHLLSMLNSNLNNDFIINEGKIVNLTDTNKKVLVNNILKTLALVLTILEINSYTFVETEKKDVKQWWLHSLIEIIKDNNDENAKIALVSLREYEDFIIEKIEDNETYRGPLINIKSADIRKDYIEYDVIETTRFFECLIFSAILTGVCSSNFKDKLNDI